MNPMKLLQAKQAWDQFQTAHPKFVPFLNAAERNIEEGSILALSVTTPEGKTIETNVKISASDMELFRSLKEMME